MVDLKYDILCLDKVLLNFLKYKKNGDTSDEIIPPVLVQLGFTKFCDTMMD